MIKILEFNQYTEYFENEEFMKYFLELKNKVLHLFPTINPNLELIIDKIYYYYYEDYKINDLINKLFYDGNIIQFKGSMEL